MPNLYRCRPVIMGRSSTGRISDEPSVDSPKLWDSDKQKVWTKFLSRFISECDISQPVIRGRWGLWFFIKEMMSMTGQSVSSPMQHIIEHDRKTVSEPLPWPFHEGHEFVELSRMESARSTKCAVNSLTGPEAVSRTTQSRASACQRESIDFERLPQTNVRSWKYARLSLVVLSILSSIAGVVRKVTFFATSEGTALTGFRKFSLWKFFNRMFFRLAFALKCLLSCS